MFLSGDVNNAINNISMTKHELFFGFVTVLGTVIAIGQTIKARNQSKELARYEYLFDIADKGIEKEKTIEELKSLKEEKQKMDNAIKNELPLLARLTVLSDRLKEDEDDLAKCYKRYKTTKEEYDQLKSEESMEIPQNIVLEIENHILPDYILKEKRDGFLRQLTIISYISALFSINGQTRNLGRLVLITSIFPLVRIIILSLPKDSTKRKKYLLSLFSKILLGITVLCLILLCFLLFDSYSSQSYILMEILLMVLLPMLVVDLFILLPLIKRKFEAKQK